METKRIVGIGLLVVGIIVLIVSVAADAIGFGMPGFGPRQMAGTAVGAIVAVVGAILMRRS